MDQLKTLILLILTSIIILMLVSCSKTEREIAEEACKRDDAASCEKLGIMWSKGEGGPKDIKKALEYFNTACMGGIKKRCHTIGLTYLKGLGVPKNIAKAKAFFEKACDDSYAVGCKDAALIWKEGIDGFPSLETARNYLNRACEKGDLEGCFESGLMLWQGEGGAADELKGLKHLQEACDGGHKEACSKWKSFTKIHEKESKKTILIPLKSLSEIKGKSQYEILHSAGLLRTALREHSEKGYKIPKALTGLSNLLIKALADVLEKPSPPEKPVYEKPGYTGAKRFSGRYEGKYDGGFLGKDGIVVKSGSKYYVILEAVLKDTSFLSLFTDRVSGYATPKGETIKLNIGRSGRDAEVLEVADKETYRDDQRSFKEEVRDSKRQYKESLQAYREELSTYKKEKVKYENDPAVKERDRALSLLPSEAEKALSALSEELENAQE